MTREEEIINEAKKYYSDNIKCYDAFLHGIQWAEENSVNFWHDASEMPNNHSYIIFIIDRYTIKTDYVPACLNHGKLNDSNWNEFVKIVKLTKWAYIKDLLPKGGEK